MKLNKKYYRWVVEITLILIVLSAIRFWMQRDIVSGIAPDISADILSGQRFELYQSKDRPVLIHFWASWCPVCKLEESSIENVAQDHPVITIAMQSGDNEELKKYMQEEKLTFKVINDESGQLSQMYKIKGVPVSFVVNKDNEIEFVEVGYTTELGLRMRLWWAGL
ncbi:MAG: protein disulfide oxidoreductase [Gammaproteobacteria bacterium]|nr:protein disulfide oxidoreductase [Gammaproteobacteria bacterium]MCW8987515.1 protein disulfide oxidoreductase [Gammaproteobacteria bacterium]